MPCLILGLFLGWKWPGLPACVAPPLVRWGVPLSLAALLLRSSWSTALAKVMVVGLLVPLLTMGVLWVLSSFCNRWKNPVLILGASVGNTGYWGLPVALALLPPKAIATAAIYDVVGTLITWSVGPLILFAPRGSHARHLTTLLGSPATRGFLLSLLISGTPWSGDLAKVLWWPARAVFVLALGLLGMHLGLTLRNRSFATAPGLSLALLCKLCCVPVLVLLVSRALDLSLIDQRALVLQGAAPTALSVLLIADSNHGAGPLASSLVVFSTLAAMVTVPLWWGLIQ